MSLQQIPFSSVRVDIENTAHNDIHAGCVPTLPCFLQACLGDSHGQLESFLMDATQRLHAALTDLAQSLAEEPNSTMAAAVAGGPYLHNVLLTLTFRGIASAAARRCIRQQWS